MSFNYLSIGSEFNAAIMNANFQHVAAGALLPLSGGNMKPTTGSLDLGDTTHQWRVYALNLYLGGTTTALTSTNQAHPEILIRASHLDANTTTANRYDRPLGGMVSFVGGHYAFLSGVGSSSSAPLHNESFVAHVVGPTATASVTISMTETASVPLRGSRATIMDLCLRDPSGAWKSCNGTTAAPNVSSAYIRASSGTIALTVNSLTAAGTHTVLACLEWSAWQKL